MRKGLTLNGYPVCWIPLWNDRPFSRAWMSLVEEYHKSGLACPMKVMFCKCPKRFKYMAGLMTIMTALTLSEWRADKDLPLSRVSCLVPFFLACLLWWLELSDRSKSLKKDRVLSASWVCVVSCSLSSGLWLSQLVSEDEGKCELG